MPRQQTLTMVPSEVPQPITIHKLHLICMQIAQLPQFLQYGLPAISMANKMVAWTIFLNKKPPLPHRGSHFQGIGICVCWGTISPFSWYHLQYEVSPQKETVWESYKEPKRRVQNRPFSTVMHQHKQYILSGTPSYSAWNPREMGVENAQHFTGLRPMYTYRSWSKSYSPYSGKALISIKGKQWIQKTVRITEVFLSLLKCVCALKIKFHI